MLEKNMDAQDRQTNEQEPIQSVEQELTDEQLLQMAEGSCTWGANCGK
ncbi:hypothetical protein [Archangium sp.]|nr:hypothetical protein [Archangium sp.]HYO58567.1 hypothetical protein [Archangium sp.]